MNRSELRQRYLDLLLEQIVPFWVRHGIDWDHGGVLTMMSEEGQVLGNDKYLWSQARSLWTFAALYNRIEPRPEFLRLADNSWRFLQAHGRDSSGRWVYRTDRQGNVLEAAISIYSDCFAVYGCSEYYRASGSDEALGVARSTFERVRRRIEEPDFCETAPTCIQPGWRPHAVPMIMTEVAGELAETTGDPELEDLADAYAGRVLRHFVRPQRRAVLEFLDADYRELPGPAGTLVVPGHAIECMWFILHRARRRGDRALAAQAAEILRWHLELGWDDRYGGLLLACDLKGRQPWLAHAEKKIWWPHTEALYATLLAHELTRESWCLRWYEKVAAWAWAHFPIPGVGEWYQRLTREGQPTSELVALPVKDPFHLPRAAMLIVQLVTAQAA